MVCWKELWNSCFSRYNGIMKKGSAKSIWFVIALLIIFNCLGCKANTTNKDDKTAAFRKREYIGTQETYGLYPGSLPCVGQPQVVVIVIDFLDDGEFECSLDDINNRFFGIENYKNGIQPIKGNDNDYFSLRDFYLRSSYGKLDIDGDVFYYTTRNGRSEYLDSREIIEEVMTFYDDQSIPWDLYDSNQDGYVDGLYFALLDYPDFSTPNFVEAADYERGSKKISQYAFIVGLGRGAPVSMIVHETVHLLGLPDVYSNVGLNDGGTGVNSVMDGPDYALGDLFTIMKCVFTWLHPQQVTKKGVNKITLTALTEEPSCAIIFPHGNPENFNWLLVEYLTNSNNEFYSSVEAGGGLRIWRVTIDPVFFTEEAEFCRSPYIYLESIHPAGVRDYFFYPGDSLTPNTELNSHYPTAFGAKQDGGIAVLQWQNSGIYLENIEIKNGKANFTVTIK